MMHSTVHCSGSVQIFNNKFLKINSPKLGTQIDHSITRSLIYDMTQCIGVGTRGPWPQQILLLHRN